MHNSGLKRYLSYALSAQLNHFKPISHAAPALSCQIPRPIATSTAPQRTKFLMYRKLLPRLIPRPNQRRSGITCLRRPSTEPEGDPVPADRNPSATERTNKASRGRNRRSARCVERCIARASAVWLESAVTWCRGDSALSRTSSD